MAVETIVTAPGFREVIFNFLWYTVELVYMVAVIAYVAYTLDIPPSYWRRRRDLAEEVPAAAVGNSWGNAGAFLKDAATVARSLKESLVVKPEETAAEAKK